MYLVYLIMRNTTKKSIYRHVNVLYYKQRSLKFLNVYLKPNILNK